MIEKIMFSAGFGAAFYAALHYLIGFPETLSYPDWFLQHATVDLLLSEFFSSLVFFSLPIAIISAGFGVLLSKTIPSDNFLVACLAVGVAVLLGVAQTMPEYGLLQAIRISTMPANWIDVPAFLAFYLTLPIVCSVSRRRIETE